MNDSPSTLHQQAIMAALSANWQQALELNKQILEVDPKNTDAINRLARAYFELGELEESKKYFEQTLEYDSYNQIASKFLKRIETFSKKGAKTQAIGDNHLNNLMVSGDLFIEEPGKTKTVTLLKVAEPQKLSLLSSGLPVKLIAKNRGISVTDQYDEYLGVIPDDLGHRLIRLIKGGNKYSACIKTIKTNSMTILIREVYRSPRFKNQPSFLDGLNVSGLALSSDHIIVPDDSDEEMSLETDDDGEVVI